MPRIVNYTARTITVRVGDEEVRIEHGRGKELGEGDVPWVEIVTGEVGARQTLTITTSDIS
jgi:hypothetical protein